jgi:hypothetical protein
MVGVTYSVICPDIYETFKDVNDFEHIIETHSDDPQKRDYLLSLSKNDEDLVNIISDSSYHTQQGEKKGFLSKIKTDKFNLPVVYMVSYKNEPSFW